MLKKKCYSARLEMLIEFVKNNVFIKQGESYCKVNLTFDLSEASRRITQTTEDLCQLVSHPADELPLRLEV